MALIVSGSKYDELLKENKKITNNLNSAIKEVEQLKEENKKILSLKDKYSLNAETLQNENNDLKATLSLVRQDVLRLQSELSTLSEKTNSAEIQEKTSEEVCEDDTIEEISPVDALERIKIYLLKNLSELNADSLKSVFDEITQKKTNIEIANEKRKKYTAKLAGILKYIVDYTKKENNLC